MALPNHTPLNYRIWHYTYLTFCGLVFFFLIAPLFVILPLSFNAEQYIHFSAKMLALDPEGFSLRWYEDMIYVLLPKTCIIRCLKFSLRKSKMSFPL